MSLVILFNTLSRIFFYFLVLIFTANFELIERKSVLIFSTIQILTQVIDIGINSIINKDLAISFKKSKKAYKHLLIKYELIYRSLTFISAPIIFIYAFYVLNDLTKFWYLAGFFVLINFLVKPVDIKLKAEQKFHILNKIEFSCYLLLIILICMLYIINLLNFLTYSIIMISFSILSLIIKKMYVHSANVYGVNNFQNLKNYKLLLKRSSGLTLNSINTQFLPNLVMPFIALSIESSVAIFFLICYRVLAIIDQITWIPFYKNLPSWYAENKFNIKTNYEIDKAIKIVIFLNITLILIFLFFSRLEFFQKNLNYIFDISSIFCLGLYFLFNRYLAMKMQKLIIFSQQKVVPQLFLISLLFLACLFNIISYQLLYIVSAFLMLVSSFAFIRLKKI